MRITKTDLYEFIERSILKQRHKVLTEIEAVLKETVCDPIKASVKQAFNHIAKQAVKLHDEYAKFIASEQLESWKYSQHLSNLNSFMNIGIAVADDQIKHVTKYIEGSVMSLRDDTIISLQKANEVKTQLAPLYKKLDDLDTLSNELGAIIKASPSGRKAYDTLVSLNVDMSEFSAEVSQVPAVRKLSVEPCLLNGGC